MEHSTYFASIIVRPDDPIANPLPAWEWFNSYVGFPPEFVQTSTDNVEGWFQELLDILQAIEQEECVYDSTTPLPTTGEKTTTTTVETSSETATTTTSSTTGPEVPPVVSTTEGDNNCVCPPTNPDCCQKAPEVLIALMKRPENLDIHLVGPDVDPNPTF